jgi:hypothetical protein
MLEEKEVALKKIKEDNKVMKVDVEQRENEIQQSKEYLRKKEIEKFTKEKEKDEHNANR